MRSNKNDSKHSAAKRIIPAAAMFALSSVMLSTSTYAWFTMNKEVEMTGLNMSATAGDGMEISLACVNASNAISSPSAPNKHPSDDTDEKGWKSSVIVGHYYETIGKLRPASTVDGENLFDATDASNGGEVANNFTTITLGDDTMANITMKPTLDESVSDAAIASADSNDAVGYYVDIPVYLRTNRKASDGNTEGDIYCKMKIQKRAEDGTLSGSSDDLYKAVRVAFIPSAEAASSSKTIFGVNKEYYHDGQAVNGAATRGAVTVETDTNGVVDTDTFPVGDGIASGLKIPFATGSDQYGHLDFTVRVWVEGESKYCSDATSGQSWNIDLAFSLDKFATDTSINTNP